MTDDLAKEHIPQSTEKIEENPQTPPHQQEGVVQVFGVPPILHSRIMKALRKAPHDVVEELLIEFSAKNLPIINIRQQE